MSSVDPLHRRFFVGTLSNLLGQGVIVVSSLALIPLIVHRVGATDFGIWILVGSIASFVFLLEIGISAGLVKYVAEHVARSEYDEGARLVGAATWLYALLGIGVCVAGLGLALVLPGLLDLHGHTRRVVPAVVALTALGAGISIPAVAPIALLRGLQRFSLVNGIVAGGAILGAGLTVGALMLGGGIVGVAAATTVSALITFAISFGVIRRVAPELTGRLVRPDRQRARRLLRFSSSVAIVQVAGRLQTRTDAIVIGAALPLRLVAPYNFAQRLAEGTRLTTEQFVKVLLPVATEIGVTRDQSALRGLFLTATRLSLAITLAVALPLIVLGGPILSLWVGRQFGKYGDLVAILAASAVFDLVAYPAASVLQGVERHPPLAWMALGDGIVNVILSIALVGVFGLVGVALATLVATVGETTLFVLPYAARTLGISLGELGREVLVRLAVPAAALAAILVITSSSMPLTSFPRLVAVLAAALTGYVFAYVAVGAGPRERDAYRFAASALVRLTWPYPGRRSKQP
jgi:O-antigen/teichoic acid export membrane protein